jgi:predicted dehydrogenase
MRYITQSEIIRLYAETERRLHTSHEDLMTGLARLSDGAVGTLTINWLTPTKIRELCVTGERGMFRVDYLTQDLYFYENAGAHGSQWETLQVLRGVNEGRMIRHVVTKKEPLRAELEEFLAVVRGEAALTASGYDGLRALELAEALVLSGAIHQPVSVLQSQSK